jgi:hypothetical protein
MNTGEKRWSGRESLPKMERQERGSTTYEFVGTAASAVQPRIASPLALNPGWKKKSGVGNGNRTRNRRSHSPVLCQLSYSHRRFHYSNFDNGDCAKLRTRDTFTRKIPESLRHCYGLISNTVPPPCAPPEAVVP